MALGIIGNGIRQLGNCESGLIRRRSFRDSVFTYRDQVRAALVLDRSGGRTSIVILDQGEAPCPAGHEVGQAYDPCLVCRRTLKRDV